MIGRVLGRLSDLGYLDDARTAEGWLRNRIERHPEGRAALLAGLLRHGVSRELAQCAVDTCLPAEAEEEVARRFLDKLYPDPASRSLWGEAERAKALRRLQARGFSHSAARRALGSPED